MNSFLRITCQPSKMHRARVFLASNSSKVINNHSIKFPLLNHQLNYHLPVRKYHAWPSLMELLHQKIPEGFENFFPKKGKDKNEKVDEKRKEETPNVEKKNETETEKNEDNSMRMKKINSNKNSNNNKNNNNNNGGPIIGTAIGILLLVAMNILFGENDASEYSSREISWIEFQNYLLKPRNVEKILVTNKNTVARVYVKRGSTGVPQGIGLNSAWNNSMKQKIDNSSSFDSIDSSSDVIEMGVSNQSHLKESAQMRRTPQLVYKFSIGSVESFERKLDETQKELGYAPREYVPVQYASDSTLVSELLNLLPTVVTILVIGLLMRSMGGAGGGRAGPFQFGKSNAKKVKKEDVNVTFADVAGCQEAKKEIMEFVDFLQDSSRFTKLGAKIPKGALLCGPPGTGKTLLAKAMAGEANVPFYSISGSDFIEMFVGVGPSRIRDLFSEARANAPCILFIDEIDAVGRERGRGGMSGGNDERENTLNQLLVEMDGFNSSTGVVVLAGTNRVDILDSALTRPGRFDRQILVDKPDIVGRKEIFNVHLKGIKLLNEDVDGIASRLAGLTPGFTGADIANICNEAAIQAARRKGESVTFPDFEKATDRVIGGMESHKIMSKDEKQIVAHHEAGHAVAGWFLEHADPLLKVTIIPRTNGALGFAQYLPKEVFLRSKEQIIDIVCMALAGRAAEEIFFGKVTTGAADDLNKVTQMVYNLIQEYGMSGDLGQLSFPKSQNDVPWEKPYSEATARAMDQEARSIVEAAYQRTLQMLTDKKNDIKMVADSLLQKETIHHNDMIDMLGPRPFKGDAAYDQFVANQQSKNDPTNDEPTDENDSTTKDDDQTLTPGLIS